MKSVSILLLMAMLTSCTYSVTIVHSQGQSSDAVDENSTPKVDASVTLPIEAHI